MTTPAMDDSPSVPRPPGAVEAVLAAHRFTVVYPGVPVCTCGSELGSEPMTPRVWHDAHVAQALEDAGCVLGDDWVVETVEQWGVQPAGVAPDAALFANRVAAELAVEPGAHRTLVTRTVTTATRTTAWKEAE